MIRMLVCLSVSETTSGGTPWATMIDATGLVLAARGVGHQNLDRAEGIQRGTSAFGPGIFQDLERASCEVSQWR